jgi:hypothetical protein
MCCKLDYDITSLTAQRTESSKQIKGVETNTDVTKNVTAFTP